MDAARGADTTIHLRGFLPNAPNSVSSAINDLQRNLHARLSNFRVRRQMSAKVEHKLRDIRFGLGGGEVVGVQPQHARPICDDQVHQISLPSSILGRLLKFKSVGSRFGVRISIE
jgi:hypothetical protein